MEAGYHRQGRVENTLYRYKAIIGGASTKRPGDGSLARVQRTEADAWYVSVPGI